jgi:cation-transporting ATPase E
MTGDGVNDALALKDADIGVAMGNGSPATRAVAQLVLLDGRFAHLPSVVAEGRRVIANIERAANLFLVKNVYSLALAVVTAVTLAAYPLAPIQLTLISTLTIGVPGAVLALGPNQRRYRSGFCAACSPSRSRRASSSRLPRISVTAPCDCWHRTQRSPRRARQQC